MPFPTKIFSRSEFKWNNRFVYALTKHHRQRVRRIRIIISNCSPLIAIAIVSWLRRRCCWTKWTSSVSSRYFQSRTWFCFRVSAVVYSKVTLAVLTEGVTSFTHVFFFFCMSFKHNNKSSYSEIVRAYEQLKTLSSSRIANGFGCVWSHYVKSTSKHDSDILYSSNIFSWHHQCFFYHISINTAAVCLRIFYFIYNYFLYGNNPLADVIYSYLPTLSEVAHVSSHFR